MTGRRRFGSGRGSTIGIGVRLGIGIGIEVGIGIGVENRVRARRPCYISAVVPARILLFALEDLRARFAGATPAGTDPRHDTAAFRAFRAELLRACAVSARAPLSLSMWWEGTYNGYALAVAAAPAEALGDLDGSAICPVDAERIAEPRPDRYPLGRAAPGSAGPAAAEGGGLWEAPFGAPAGHFGAPGMRRVT